MIRRIATIVLAVTAFTLFSRAVFAETRTISNVTGRTRTDSAVQGVFSRTTATSIAPYLYVNIRAHAFDGIIKDEKSYAKQNIRKTPEVYVGLIYPYQVARHYANTQYGAIEIYTSAYGNISNSCWWNYGYTGHCPTT